MGRVDGRPLEQRAIARIGPHQYAIEGDGFVAAEGEQSVWHVDLRARPAPVCDCPAFISSTDDPQTCKHIRYLLRVEQQLNAAMYERIFGGDEAWPDVTRS